MNPPILLAFLLADKVFREAETGKVHVAGTFNRVGALQFPFVFPQIHVYLALTDLAGGRHTLSLEIRHMDRNETLLKVQQPIQGSGPLDVIEVILIFNGVPIPEPGSLELVAGVDDNVVATRLLRVLTREEFPTPPPPGGPSGRG